MEPWCDTKGSKHEKGERQGVRQTIDRRRRHERFVDIDEVIMPQRLQIRERFDGRKHRHLGIGESGQGEAQHGIKRADRKGVAERGQQTDHRDSKRFHRQNEEQQTEHQPSLATIDRESGKTIEDQMTTDAENEIDQRVRNQFAYHRDRVVASGSMRQISPKIPGRIVLTR